MATQPPPIATPDLASLRETAKAAGLRYVSDSKPGIARVRAGVGFDYRHPDGSTVSDEETLTRIRKLAIPPASKMCGFVPIRTVTFRRSDGMRAGASNIATIRAGVRSVTKANTERCFCSASALPRIRAQVQKDLERPGIPREKVLAAIVACWRRR